MRTWSWIVVALAAVVAAPVGRVGAQASSGTSATAFYPASDAPRDIDAAVAAARQDGKYVLLDFGADWCPDCRVLGGLFEDATVAPIVAANFHVVRVDVGRRDKNGDLAAKYGATSGDWIPALVVLDADRKAIAVTDDHVRVTRRTTAAELAELLRGWAPKKTVRSLTSFEQGGVRVSVALQEDGAHHAWLAAEFEPTRTGVHLYDKDLPPQGIDGLGRPTRLAVVSSRGLTVTGGVTADRPVTTDRIEELNVVLPVYPAGPVTLRLPVRVDRGASAELSLGYMACGGLGCQPPVTDKRVRVTVSQDASSVYPKS